MNEPAFTPGSLVHARGREWIVLSGSDGAVLRLRPVTGSEEDITRVCLDLEPEPVRPARFPPPRANQIASHDAALLLRDALLLSLRRGAGPFRSFGQIAVEPRAYQLVPLMMALKLDPVRLLIADDVGVGKTIEAGLIARELLDRGEVSRLAVLCPPHLVEQWVGELEARFHIRAIAITATSAARLELDLPATSVFDAFPFTVVSLDYIKGDRRRDSFLHHCPELIIVDEAHTCAATTGGRHQRYELLRGLADAPDRHVVLLTATPHSGDDAAFYRLLGLLEREFEALASVTGAPRDRLREHLARYFVQRRRQDIEEWQEGGRLFPKRETAELTYRLSGPWEDFFRDVLAYCRNVIASAADDERRQRLSFWGTLALLRCAASSPAAAVLALRTRAGFEDDADDKRALLDQLFDGEPDALSQDDLEPAAGFEDPALAALVSRATELAGMAGDPKLRILVEHVKRLVAEGFSPVVFCRYIATAHYLRRALAAALGDVRVAVATGEDANEQRAATVASLADEDRCVLVATDCISEGINLQESFDAVVHYDLSWNPTRHEQREGRVDRFGQESPKVRATLIYGANNPVDGVVLEVILRKADRIRAELGVPVPLPDDGHTLSTALMKALLLRQGVQPTQEVFDFGGWGEARALDVAWRDAAEKAKQSRTIFNQRRLRPAEVLPEWRRALSAVGGEDDVRRFVDRALARLGSGLEPLKRGYRAPLTPLPDEVRERLDAEGLAGTLRLDFAYPPRGKARTVQRSHPLVTVLAESLLERTLTAAPDTAPALGALGRVGCWSTEAVTARTVVALLRLRHQLVAWRWRQAIPLLVEEAAALAWAGADGRPLAEGDDALNLLRAPPAGDLLPHVRDRILDQALGELDQRRDLLAGYATRRAEALLADHERVRESARATGRHEVHPLLPPDVIALYVLLPRAR